MAFDPKTAEDTTDRVVSNGKILAASGRRSDFRAALGRRRRHYLKDEESGRWTIDVPREDTKGINALLEVTSPSRRLAADHAKEFGARLLDKNPLVRMRTRDGRAVMVHPENQRWLNSATGALPAPRYRGVSVYSGPNGMLFRDIAGYWMPTGRTCLGTPLFGDGIARGPQPDPDGNVWELVNGEWEITQYDNG